MQIDIPWGLIWPILGLQIVLAITGLISLFKTDAVNLRGPRLMWVLIILLGNIVGSVAYFVIGRKEV